MNPFSRILQNFYRRHSEARQGGRTLPGSLARPDFADQARSFAGAQNDIPGGCPSPARPGKWIRRNWADESGVAAIMMVILAIVILGTLALNFFAETGQKQSGSALTYSQTNALFITDGGIRYLEKCLRDYTAGCPAILDNLDWKTNLEGQTLSPISLGGGEFEASFPVHVNNDADNIRVNCKGTFHDAIRALSATISRVSPCVLGEQAITYCSSVDIKNAASSTDPNDPVQVCPTVQIDPLYPSEFPDDPVGCPNPEYPDYENGSSTLGAPYQYCNFTLKDTYAVTLGATSTLTLAGNATDTTITVASGTDYKVGMSLQITVGSRLDGVVSSGDTVITVEDVTPYSGGQVVKIISASDSTVVEENIIASLGPGANQITLQNATINDYPDSSIVDLTDDSNSAQAEAVTVSSKAGNVLTLTGALVNNFPVGSSVDSQITMYVANNFSMENSAELKVKGDLTVNIGNNAEIKNVTEIQLFGTLTLRTDQDFKLKNAARLNEIQGFSPDLLILAGDDAEVKNSVYLAGGIIANDAITIQNDAQVLGAVVGNSVTLKNNSTLIFDPLAGGDSQGISSCSSSERQPPKWTEG